MAFIPSEKDFSQYDQPQGSSATGTFLRAAGRAPMDLAEYLGAPADKLKYPEFLHKKEGDLQHPIAEFMGHSVWPGGTLLKGFGYAGKMLSGLNRLNNIKNIGSIEQEAENADQSYQMANENVNDFPSKLPSIRNKLESIQGKQQQLAQEYPSESGLQNEPEINLSNRLPGATGDELVPQAQAQRQSYVDQLRQHLGQQEPEPMDVQYQNAMNRDIRAGRQQIGQGYNNLKSSFEGQNVTVNRTRPLKEIQDELFSLVKEGDLNSPEIKQLAEELSQPEQKEVPASQVLTQFRTVDKLSKNAYKKAYERSESMTEEQRNNAISQAEQYKSIAEKLSKILEKEVNPDFRSELQGLNSAWREHASLYKNPLARKIESGRGITGSNILDQMRGNDIGQQLLRRYTMSNPESLRSALGHTYNQNPEQLLNASPYEQQFIQQSEHLPSMITRLRNAQHNEHAAAQETERLRNESSRVERAFKEDIKREAAKEEARKLSQQYKDLQSKEKELNQLLSQKKSTLKQKVELGTRLSQVRKDKEAIMKILKKIGYGVLIAGVGVEAGGLLNKVFK